MNKYTVVYADTWMCGSHRQSITRFIYIMCSEESIIECIELANVDPASVWFIFNGRCTLQGEGINETDK